MSLFIGIICLAVAAAGPVWVGRRAFYRRNIAGVEEHASFGSMFRTKTLENFVCFLSGLSALVAVVSLVVFFTSK